MNSKSNLIKKFKSENQELIYKLEILIKKMPYKGLTEEECQRTCLEKALKDFENCINGVEECDFVKNKI